MSINSGQPQSSQADRHRAGPQGTRLLSAAEMQRLAQEETSSSNARACAHEPVLQGIHGMKSQRFVLRQGRQTVGRRGDNDIVLNDDGVSATHAWIINQHGHYVLMNTLSTNGTFVNDKRIHETVLVHGDRVRFGQAEFTFLTHEQHRHGMRLYLYGAAAMLGLLGLAGVMWWML